MVGAILFGPVPLNLDHHGGEREREMREKERQMAEAKCHFSLPPTLANGR